MRVHFATGNSCLRIVVGLLALGMVVSNVVDVVDGVNCSPSGLRLTAPARLFLRLCRSRRKEMVGCTRLLLPSRHFHRSCLRADIDARCWVRWVDGGFESVSLAIRWRFFEARVDLSFILYFIKKILISNLFLYEIFLFFSKSK